ncbi:uncharacterized protein [Cherax quadricarinatus]|uniref:uncharacterized protein n=1 Tax=Cherax quadricarinatus TaxID=27406 RepID=UPI00387E6CEA
MTTLGVLIGTTCWHMAYREATLHALAREQHAVHLAKEHCRHNMEALRSKMATSAFMKNDVPELVTAARHTVTLAVPQQVHATPEQIDAHPQARDESHVRERSLPSTKHKQTVMVSVLLGCKTLSMVRVWEAMEQQQQHGGNSHHVQVQLSSFLAQEELREDLARSQQDPGILISTGTPMEVDGRRRPSLCIVVVVPSIPPGLVTGPLEEFKNDDHSEVILTLPPLLHLLVTLHQMKALGVTRALPLLTTDVASNTLAMLLSECNSSLGVQILNAVRYDFSTPVGEIIAEIDIAIQSASMAGVLLTADPRVLELAAAAAADKHSHVPWFVMAENFVDFLKEAVSFKYLNIKIVEYGVLSLLM